MKKRFLCWMLCLCLLGGLAACRTKPAEEGLTSESPQSETDPGDVPEPEEPEPEEPQISFTDQQNHTAVEKLRKMDVDSMTPREALDALYELKAILQ